MSAIKDFIREQVYKGNRGFYFLIKDLSRPCDIVELCMYNTSGKLCNFPPWEVPLTDLIFGKEYSLTPQEEIDTLPLESDLVKKLSVIRSSHKIPSNLSRKC